MALPLQTIKGEADGRPEEKRGRHPMDFLQRKRYFRPDEVAALLALSRRTIYRMIRDGRLPGVKLGAGPWRIPRETLADLLGLCNR
jgi:excisionase family DNA binding protein